MQDQGGLSMHLGDKTVEPVDIVICRQDLRWNLCGQCRGSGGGKWKGRGVWKANDISRVA